MSDLIERLRIAAEAYPEDVFGKTTGDDRRQHGDIVQRAAATMGRHMAPLLLEAAAALEAAREDGERLDWLDIQRGDDVRQDPHSGDPVLVAHYWAIEGQCTDIRDAIDQARGKGVQGA